jgi:hypothetical protein
MMTSIAAIHLPPLDRVTLFGLIAVSLMLVFYALEDRSSYFVLAFAGACALGSTYGFLQGVWPFGIVEGIWSVVAVRKWYQQARANPVEAEYARRPVDAMIQDLLNLSHQVAPTTFEFRDEFMQPMGFVQIYCQSSCRILVHRLWAASPGKGVGSQILQTLCELADLHSVEIVLRPLPFGPKPYPRTVDELRQWYDCRGFVGTAKRMIRVPQSAPVAVQLA